MNALIGNSPFFNLNAILQGPGLITSGVAVDGSAQEDNNVVTAIANRERRRKILVDIEFYSLC